MTKLPPEIKGSYKGRFLKKFMTNMSMMPDTILMRYGELFLKGKNRVVFERKLVENIHKLVVKAGITNPTVIKSQGRLLISYFPEHAALRRVFGLVSYSPAVRVEKNTEEIQRKAVELLHNKKGKFKVATRRSDKKFPVTSPDFNRIVGKYIEENTSLEFSSTLPEVILEIEINQEGAYLFFETIACNGGLPTGVEGKVLLLVESSHSTGSQTSSIRALNEAETSFGRQRTNRPLSESKYSAPAGREYFDDEASLLAGLLFMKRGCSVVPVAFVEKDVSLLQEFSPVELKLNLIKDFKELESLAAAREISIVVTGQMLKDKVERKTSLIIMKPLIAYSEKQVEEQLKWYRRLCKFSS